MKATQVQEQLNTSEKNTIGVDTSLQTNKNYKEVVSGHVIDAAFDTAQLDQIAKISRISLKHAIKERNNTKSQELKHRMPRKRYYNGVGKIMVNDISIRQQKLENIPFKKLASRNDIGSISCKIGSKKVQSGAAITHQRQQSLNQQIANQQLAFELKGQENSRFDSNKNYNVVQQKAQSGPNRHFSSSLTNDRKVNHTIVTPDVVMSGQQLLSIGQQQQSTNLSEFTQDPYTQYYLPQPTRKQYGDEGLFMSTYPLQEIQGSREGAGAFSSDKAQWGPRFSSKHQTQQARPYNLGIDLEMFRRRTVMVQSGSTAQEPRPARIPFQSATAHHTFRNLNELPLLEEAAVSHMMEKMEYIPKIKFTLERGSYNTSDKFSDQQSGNTWLHQRQKEQESRDQERNDRIIMKRLNQLYPNPKLSSRNNDEDIHDTQYVISRDMMSGGKARPGADTTSVFNTVEQQKLNRMVQRQQTMGIYSGRERDQQIESSVERDLRSVKQRSVLQNEIQNELSEQNSAKAAIRLKDKESQDYDSRSPVRAESYQKKQQTIQKDRLSKIRDSESTVHVQNLLASQNNNQRHAGQNLKKMLSSGIRSSHGDTTTYQVEEDDDNVITKQLMVAGETMVTGNEQASEFGKQYQDYSNYLNKSDEELIAFSSGNIYNANTNPQVKKFVAQIAGFLENTDSQVNLKKEHMSRINLMMKQTKNAYIQTLLEGEEKKHCSGIQKRFMETKYNVRQHQQLQPEEDEVSIKKEQKKLRDKEKILQRKKRALIRVENFWRCQTIGSSMPLQVPNNLIPNAEDMTNPAVLSFAQSQLRPCVLNRLGDHDTAKSNTSGIQQEQYAADMEIREAQNLIEKSEAAKAAPSSRRMTVAPSSVQMNLNIIKMERQQKQFRMSSVPQDLDLGSRRDKFGRTATYMACDLALNFVDKQKVNAQQNLSQKKAVQVMLNKKLKVFRDAFCIQKLPPPYDQQIEELYKADPNAHVKSRVIENLNTLYRHLSTEKFERQRPLTNKKIQAQFKPKPLVLSAQDLGLEKQKDFQELSQFLFRGSNFGRLDHREFSKQAFREHLNDRYSKQITDRIMLVLESQNMIKPQMSEMDYAQMICDMLNLGPEFYKKLLFACLSKLNPGRVCEHDIFALLQTFKQIDSYYFYRELINRKEVPRDFKDLKDNSDQIFFEAFAPDIIEISHTMSIRKRLLGIFDNDKEKNFLNDIQETSFESYNEYEEEIVRQIEYTASIISKTYSSKNSLLNEVLDTLTNERDLLKVRAKFIQMVIDNKILSISKKKQQEAAEQKNTKQLNVQTLFKPPSNIYPCIGADTSRQTGNRISNCIYMNYDDFMKLIDFPTDTVSSFMDDFIDHLTAGCVSLKHFEEHLGKFREYERENRDKKPHVEPKNYLEGTTVIEYLEKKNVEVYGNSHGQPSYSIQAKRNRQGKSERKNTTHVIDQPYTTQDHFINGEFCGKMLIQNQQSNTAKEKKKSSAKGKKKVTMKIEETESSEDSEQDHLRKHSGKTVVVHISDDQIIELVEYRNHFKDPQFFKIFRIFYALAVVPEDAQNNPFLLFLDKESVVRNFSKVFGVDNEEVAIRFYCLLMKVKNQPPRKSEKEIESSHKIERKKGEVDVVQFFRAVKYICHSNLKQSSHFMRLAFRFLDYDDNGSIGSVDILNLRKTFNTEMVDKIVVLFEKEQIKKTLARRIYQVQEKANIAKKLQKSILNQWMGSKNGLGKLAGAVQSQGQAQGQDKNRMGAPGKAQAEESEDESLDSPEESQDTFRGISPDVQRVLNDPWNRFLLEVAQLRDYFVEHSIQSKPKPDDRKDQQFLTMHNYQHNFLSNFTRKYELKAPTIVHFFKSKFEYPPEMLPVIDNNPEPIDCYKGFDPAQEKCPVTDELIKMQETLDAIAKSTRSIMQMIANQNDQ